MPNVLIAAYVHPRALPGAMGNNWAYSPPREVNIINNTAPQNKQTTRVRQP